MKGIKKSTKIKYAAIAFAVLIAAMVRAMVALGSGIEPSGRAIHSVSPAVRAESPFGDHQGNAPMIKSTQSSNSRGEAIKWQAISGGGTSASQSSNFRLSGIAGQTAAGDGTSSSYVLSDGFLYVVTGGGGACDCNPGDPNADLNIDVGDAVTIINYIFKGGPPPMPYATCSGDANSDCSVNVGDAVYLIEYIFRGGPGPVTCGQWRDACGPILYK